METFFDLQVSLRFFYEFLNNKTHRGMLNDSAHWIQIIKRFLNKQVLIQSWYERKRLQIRCL